MNMKRMAWLIIVIMIIIGVKYLILLLHYWYCYVIHLSRVCFFFLVFLIK